MVEPATSTRSPDLAAEAVERATQMVADTLAELMGFWNFKPSMGRVWAVLYLSREPLDAEAIAEQTGLSAGSVSMTLQELLHWGVVHRSRSPGLRRRHFEAETDIVAMVTRTIRERELGLVEESVQRFEDALALLEAEGSSSVPDRMLRTRFVATRVGNLLRLARGGRGLLEQLVRAGKLDLDALRGTLSRQR